MISTLTFENKPMFVHADAWTNIHFPTLTRGATDAFTPDGVNQGITFCMIIVTKMITQINL